MDQERQIQEFFDSLLNKFNTIHRRLENLEGSESPATNFYGTMYGSATVVTTAVTVAGTYYQVLNMTYGDLKGFTANADTLVCDKAGIYLVHYALGVELTGTTLVRAKLTGDALAATTSVSAVDGVSGTNGWLTKTVPMDLEVGDIISLYVTASINTTNVLVTYAMVTLHRIDDN